MNISSKYDLSDIVKELGSSNSAKASKAAGPEGVFSAILSDLAAAGITGKVAAEVAEAVESGAGAPLSSPANDLLAHLKAMQGEASAAARDSEAALANVSTFGERDGAAAGAQGLLAFLQARVSSAEASGQIVVPTETQESAVESAVGSAKESAEGSAIGLSNEKQSNPFASLLTNDALRITKLKDSRAVLLGPNVASKPEEGASKLNEGASNLNERASKPKEVASNRVENKLGSLLNQVSESAASKNDDSPEYWNRETARLLAEMGRGNGASEFIPDAPSASAKHIEASNAAPTNASAFSAQPASLIPAAANNSAMVSDNENALSGASELRSAVESTLNSAAANNAATFADNTSAMNRAPESSRAPELNRASGLTRAPELKSAVESTRSGSNAHTQNSKQISATAIESAAVSYAQAQRPARFDNIGLLGQTATESQAMSATNAQAIAQAKTEAGQANQQLSAQRSEHLAASAAPLDAQLFEKAQQQRKALTRSQEAGAIVSTSKINSELNTAALKQQFANVVVNEISTQSGNVNSPLQTNPLGTAFAPIVNQAKQARDNSPLTQESETEINLQELELGVSQGTNTKANEAANQRVSIANLPQGIASRINPHLAKGLGSGPTKISISLFPENYGQVDVEFVYSEEAGLRVSLSSESAETTRLLQSNSSGLRETLLGNSLADVSVDVNAHGQGKQEGSAENPQGAAAARQIAGESATEGEPLKSKATGDNSDGLDTYV